MNDGNSRFQNLSPRNFDNDFYENKDKAIYANSKSDVVKYEKITEINKENPININNLYMHIQVANSKDWVSPYLASLVKLGFNRHFTNNKTKNISIDCNASALDHSIQLSNECLQIIKNEIDKMGNPFVAQ